MEKLTNLNFTKIGDWEIKGDYLNFIVPNKNNLLVANSLYVFVLNDQGNEKIVYVGKTTQTLDKRFYGYIRGNGLSTNSKIHRNIKKALGEKKEVKIWALLDETPLSWGIYNINIAAGLEDAFIEIEKPSWNKGKTETEIIEVQVQVPNEIEQTVFPVKIKKTYYEFGIVNPGVKASSLLGKHNEPIKILIGKESKEISSFINRTANQNKSVRIHAIKELAIYYQKEYNLGEIATLKVIDKNTIQII